MMFMPLVRHIRISGCFYKYLCYKYFINSVVVILRIPAAVSTVIEPDFTRVTRTSIRPSLRPLSSNL